MAEMCPRAAGRVIRGPVLSVLSLALLCMGPLAAHAVQKGASISLRARWQGTSYLLEAAEFLAEEGGDRYWRFVEGLAPLERNGATPAECWRSILQQASAHVPASVAKILPVALGVRQYSVKLELFRQLAGQLYANATISGCCFADIGGRLVTTDAELDAALKDAVAGKLADGAVNAQLHPFDHIYNPQLKGAAGAIHALLYGPPGTECFARMHAAIKAAADASAAAAAGDGARPLMYAHRPVLGAACRAREAGDCLAVGTEEQLVLPGYGVEAVLKNMEYSAMDDGKKAPDAAAAAASDAAADDSAPLGEAKGFRFDVLAKRRPELRQELLTFRDALLAGEDDEAIKVWQLKDAGLQATWRISQSSDPMALLQEISQGFPGIVSSLTRQSVPSSLRVSVQSNQRQIHPGITILMLNGLLVEVYNFELYGFIDRLRIELRMVAQLKEAGLQAKDALTVLAARSSDTSDATASDVRLDLAPYSKLPWLNSAEKDKRLGGAGRNIMGLLQMFPGQIRPLQVNAFSIIYVGNPTSPAGLAAARVFMSLYDRMLPARFALLPVVPEAVARAIASRATSGVLAVADPPPWSEMAAGERFVRAFATMRGAFGGAAALRLWARFADTAAEPGPADEGALKEAFTSVWKRSADSPETKKGKVAAKKPSAEAWEDLLEGKGYSSEAGMVLAEMSAFALRKGLASLGRPVVWVNGAIQGLSEDEVEGQINAAITQEHRFLQENLYFGRIADDEPLLASIMELSTAVRRWNPAVLGVGDDDAGEAAQKITLAAAVTSPDAAALTYLYAPPTASAAKSGAAWGAEKVYPVTHWVVADLATPRGRELAAAAIDRLLSIEDDPDVARARVALIPSPAAAASSPADAEDKASTPLAGISVLDALMSQLLRAYAAAGDKAADGATLQLLRRVLRAPEAASLAWRRLDRDGIPSESELGAQLLPIAASAGAVPISGGTAAAAAAAFGGLAADKLRAAAADAAALARLARGPLGLEAGVAAVVTNGRVITDWSPKRAEAGEVQPASLTAEDFGLMHMYAYDIQPGEAVVAAVRRTAKSYLSPPRLSDATLVAASAIGAQTYPDSRWGFSNLQPKQISELIGKLKGQAIQAGGPLGADTALSIVAIINPLTREAQRLSQVLRFVGDVLGDAASIQLHLNPRLDLSELPLKSYYTYALPEFPRDEDGQLGLPGAPSAYFPRLPAKRVLTLNMEVPEAWLVEATKAVYDLDNLRLVDVPESVAYAEYELEALILSGSCTESMSGGRPGAPPRGLELQLGTPSSPRLVDTLVMSNMGYFQLKTLPGVWQLGVAPGRSRDLFGILPPQGSGASGLVDSITTYVDSFSGRQQKLRVRKRPGHEGEQLLPPDDDPDAVSMVPAGENVINVFTVASGHMYERLQKIMILSVIKNTKSRVKFWIIKNYMSPHHRRIIPEMAKRFGFDYEFVTYKWPHWLHKQTDKQRIIWAYKILFLDVLFPLDVRRVIFVDSDQVVRADLWELMEMDLQGAPLAYTPFCDNNREMDEFRFWKGGFWRDHLRGKPYHISALYVIDLARFRRRGAGDHYRMVYESLSKDPNSLANLDQDLPNYAQHQIPIHSLPQPWLWCESWCGNATKPRAKTIDLCNNPKTKEPKLQAARRIISEWPALDEEQATFTREMDERYAREQAGTGEVQEELPAAGSGGSSSGQEEAGDVRQRKQDEEPEAAAEAAEVEKPGAEAEGSSGGDDGSGDRSEL